MKYPIYIPFISKNQKSYVIDCLDTNWISSKGKYVELFEKKLAEFINVKEVITVCNGSVSLMLILKALNIGFGDEVIVPSLTYAACISSINLLGATAVLTDSDDNFQMDFSKLDRLISKKTKAVMIPELYGDAPDVLKLKTFCKNNNIHMIEDSAEAFGCSIDKNMIGSFGIASSFSFFGNKSITCGEGGAVATNDKSLADNMRLLKNQSCIGKFKHIGPGFNFRMTNIQAAIGLAQLEDFDIITNRKKEIAARYREFLSPKIKRIIPKINSTEWMPLFLLPRKLSYTKLQKELNKKGIDTRPAFIPIHLMGKFNLKIKHSLSNSEKIYKHGFNLPSYPNLTNTQLTYIINQVNLIVGD